MAKLHIKTLAHAHKGHFYCQFEGNGTFLFSVKLSSAHVSKGIDRSLFPTLLVYVATTLCRHTEEGCRFTFNDATIFATNETAILIKIMVHFFVHIVIVMMSTHNTTIGYYVLAILNGHYDRTTQGSSDKVSPNDGIIAAASFVGFCVPLCPNEDNFPRTITFPLPKLFQLNTTSINITKK